MKLKLISSTLITLFLLFFSCSSFNSETPPDVKLVNEIRNSTAKKLEKQKSLYLIGTGSQMMHEIEMLIMSFNYYNEVDLKSSIELIVGAVGEFLLEINNKEEIRPYLCKYPFTPKNVEINIFVYKPDRTRPPSNKIQCISANEGILTYYRNIPEKQYELVHEETYDQAVQLVKSENEIEN